MKTLIYVFLGGGTGSVLRYICQQVIGQGFVESFPLGTFFVNIVGSFLIGIFYTLSARFNLSVEMRMLLTVGLCGGFTTFSTFSSDSLNLLKGELYGVFTLYALLSVVIGISFAFAGAWISKNIF
ncbi:MAG: fluoride efflux transporter CrcB [Bacteroidaceae bacterium]